MPNWCENELYIKGKKSEVEAFIEAVRGGRDDQTDFDFAKIIPYPEEYDLADKARREWEETYRDVPWNQRPPAPQDGFNQGGYQWCCGSWGTKWNARDTRFRKTTRGCIMNFNTAWSPPTPVIMQASRLFPKLEFHLEYWECGAGFKGVLRVKGGEIIEEWTDAYRGSRGG